MDQGTPDNPPRDQALSDEQIAKLKRFVKEIIRHAWDAGDLDGGEIQDLAEKLGLIRSEPFDPEVHKVSDYDGDVGDPIYVLEDWLK